MAAQFETLKSEIRDFGASGFVSVERRRVQDNGNPNANEFLVIARGFYLKDGTAKRRNFVTVPDNPEVKAFVADALKAV